MLRLLLLRHAKSDWSHGGLPDHDRPLNSRGRSDAARVGRHLRRLGLVPAAALISSARRTTETAQLVLAAAGTADPEVGLPRAARRIPRLYGAPAAGILRVVREQGGAASPLLVVGHNPGMMELAASFRGRFRPYPQAALLVALAPVSRWSDLNPATPVRVESFTRPRDLRPERTAADSPPT